MANLKITTNLWDFYTEGTYNTFMKKVWEVKKKDNKILKIKDLDKSVERSDWVTLSQNSFNYLDLEFVKIYAIKETKLWEPIKTYFQQALDTLNVNVFDLANLKATVRPDSVDDSARIRSFDAQLDSINREKALNVKELTPIVKSYIDSLKMEKELKEKEKEKEELENLLSKA